MNAFAVGGVDGVPLTCGRRPTLRLIVEVWGRSNFVFALDATPRASLGRAVCAARNPRRIIIAVVLLVSNFIVGSRSRSSSNQVNHKKKSESCEQILLFFCTQRSQTPCQHLRTRQRNSLPLTDTNDKADACNCNIHRMHATITLKQR